MPKAKEESDTESQKTKTKTIRRSKKSYYFKEKGVINRGCSVRNRGVEGRTLSELQAWLGNAILRVIQQLKEDIHAKGES